MLTVFLPLSLVFKREGVFSLRTEYEAYSIVGSVEGGREMSTWTLSAMLLGGVGRTTCS